MHYPFCLTDLETRRHKLIIIWLTVRSDIRVKVFIDPHFLCIVIRVFQLRFIKPIYLFHPHRSFKRSNWRRHITYPGIKTCIEYLIPGHNILVLLHSNFIKNDRFLIALIDCSLWTLFWIFCGEVCSIDERANWNAKQQRQPQQHVDAVAHCKAACQLRQHLIQRLLVLCGTVHRRRRSESAHQRRNKRVVEPAAFRHLQLNTSDDIAVFWRRWWRQYSVAIYTTGQINSCISSQTQHTKIARSNNLVYFTSVFFLRSFRVKKWERTQHVCAYSWQYFQCIFQDFGFGGVSRVSGGGQHLVNTFF